MPRVANIGSRWRGLREPIAPAFVAAIALHLLAVLAIGFSWQFQLPSRTLNTIAVTVALTPAKQAPEHAEHVAADNQMGQEQAVAEAPQTRLVMQTSLTLSRELGSASGSQSTDTAAPERQDQAVAERDLPVSAPSDSVQQTNPRAGSVAARRSLDADYLARWRARVEQVGNALYRGETPAGDGDVRLLVTVLADGTLDNIRILQSSGNASLDQAAQDTVVLAAPFPRFPKALAQQAPRLEIIRTWQFRTQAVSPD